MKMPPQLASMLTFAQEKAAKAAHHAAGHHKPPLPRWLIHLGALGVFGVSIVDSSVVPLPLPGSTDLLLLFLVAHHGNPWLLPACAIAGSMIGGYLTWSFGKKGGEAALGRYVSKRILKAVSNWVEHHSWLAVLIPAMLPPPTPLQPFLLAAGALGVSRRRFLIAFGAARTLRYGLVAWLGVRYGRSVVRLWERYVAEYTTPVLWTLGVITVAGVSYGWWKLQRAKAAEAAEDQAAPEAVPGRAPLPVAGQ
ncbi:MAG TPA: VTT domain-containing protein [Acidisarcina sp.]